MFVHLNEVTALKGSELRRLLMRKHLYAENIPAPMNFLLRQERNPEEL